MQQLYQFSYFPTTNILICRRIIYLSGGSNNYFGRRERKLESQFSYDTPSAQGAKQQCLCSNIVRSFVKMPRMKRSCAYITHQAKLLKRRQRQREKERDAQCKQSQRELIGEDIEHHDYMPLVPQNREEPIIIVTLSIPEETPKTSKKPTASLARKLAEKLRKQRRRQDPEYRKRERERDALRKQQRRKDPIKRRMENERAAERRRQKRKAERERKQLVSMLYHSPTL